ncbi:MAG: RNA polymerase factor sigma-54 [Pseudomonadales bacterium]|nr:RNA polymerase factor sigma-54 [Pseudomonadales bacterium]MCP5185385.1 RNA polymerase factor sigma-54 [Pseudomonadales bacterium]
MKPTLALRMGQQLAMTPQLQQAIRLLQLSTVDLEQEIQTMVTENPMLEYDGAEGPTFESLPTGEEESPQTGKENSERDVNIDADDHGIPEDLPVDSRWEDVYESSSAPSGPSEGWEQEDRNTYRETLSDHLLWQLNLTPMSDNDRLMATLIIDAIDDDGMLTTTPEDILESVREDLPETELDEVLAVLKLVQHFDPIGVGARDLRECLLIQLGALSADTPWRNEAIQLVDEHLASLGSHDYATLSGRLKLQEAQLADVVRLIQSLHPRPGATVNTEPEEFVVPDVIVRKVAGKRGARWVVELNADALPRIRLNEQYAELARSVTSASDATYLRDHLNEARWFLKSIQSRHDTLLKVATKIVEMQRGFFEYGEEAMKPMVLADIAAAVDMHESTISRVTSRKYMHTPRGVFELKYFFSSHVASSTGGEVSSTVIRALIKKLVADENARKPLSDSQLATMLAKQNIKVARRTVAKYRESLRIPPSNERKRIT